MHNFVPLYWLTNTMYNNNQNEKLMTKEEMMYREERQLRAIVDCNLLTTDCVTTGTVARRLKMKASELYRKLKERKILYHSDGMWMLMPEYISCVDEGWCGVREERN